MPKITAYRGSILHFLKKPGDRYDTESYQYFSDGVLVVESGKIKMLGEVNEVMQKLPENDDLFELFDYSGYLIMPGFIDTHVHYPQTEIIASYGEQLLEWLQNYVYPTEKKYWNREHAKQTADFFLAELLRNGTTTAAVYSTVHANSAEVLFECAAQLNMLILTGKILMDRNAPDYLRDTPEKAYAESKQLIEKWHGKGRALYAITPRFAPTSTEAQLEITAALKKEFPTTYLQTHISENRDEIAWVKELFPWSKDYTDVYDHFDLLGERSIFGHAIHLSEREFKRFHDTNSVMAWCPPSNFFLGSGLFKLGEARKYKNRIGLATDMGGGSTFSLLRTLSEAYKVAALQGLRLSPLESFYYITLGNAEALSLADRIGNFALGKEADFVVLNMKSTPLLANKMARAKNLEEKLFNLSILGDDRVIKATYVCGEMRHIR
jgi:guanine deaminase